MNEKEPSFGKDFNLNAKAILHEIRSRISLKSISWFQIYLFVIIIWLTSKVISLFNIYELIEKNI